MNTGTMSAAQHHQKYTDLVKKAQQLNAEKQNDEGFLSSEDQKSFDEMVADAQKHKDRAAQLKALEKSVAAMDGGQPLDSPIPTGDSGGNDSVKIKIRQGMKGGSPDYKEIDVSNYVRASQAYRDAFLNYLRTGEKSNALQSDDAAQGGYLIADQVLAAGILKEVDDLLFIRQRANVRTVTNSKTLGIRKRSSRASSFAWGAELQAPTADTALAYGKKVLEPHYATGSVLVSNDLIAMTEIDAAAEAQGEIAYNGATLMEDAYLTGDGDNKPLGVFTASSDGISTSRDVQTGSATNFTYAGLVSCKYSLKASHRMNARWMFHRDGISKLAQLVDSDGQPLFRVGAGRQQDAGAPEDILLGLPVDESERAPNTFTTGLYVGILANWRYYDIADGLDMSFMRLNELNARTNQTEFLSRLKTDGLPTLEEGFARLITD